MKKNQRPLARQVRQLRRHYDRLARTAARLEGRAAPTPGLPFRLTLAAMVMQTGKSKRACVDELLRKMSAERNAELTEE